MSNQAPEIEPHDNIKDKYSFFKHTGLILVSLFAVDILFDDKYPKLFNSALYKASFISFIIFMIIGYILYERNKSINKQTSDFWIRIVAVVFLFGLMIFEQLLK